MKLNVIKRSADKKSETKRLRREGSIPAIIYHQGKGTDAVAVNDSELQSLMRTIAPGRLSTTIFQLTDEKGATKKVILKEIQYEPTTYKIQHLDFEELVDNVKINVKVPIELVGVVDCAGVKLGGVLRQVIRHLRVRCLPKDIPTLFQIDVKNMALFDSRRLSDLEIPQTVRPLVDLDEVAVIIAKR